VDLGEGVGTGTSTGGGMFKGLPLYILDAQQSDGPETWLPFPVLRVHHKHGPRPLGPDSTIHFYF